jgi:hypothetical protein
VTTAHRFDVPDVDHPVSARVGHAATLLGYDLSPGENVVAGSPFTLTLTWRAEAGAATRDLKVFTHLVGEDGAVVAQHDSVPVNWSRPTEGWVPGEILIDVHELVWQTTDVSGPGELRVGMYDPASGVRVLWEDGQDAIALSGALSIRARE